MNQIPCQSTIDVCKIANDCLRKSAFKINFDYDKLLLLVEDQLNIHEMFVETDFSHDIDHKINLLMYIAEEFIHTRATYIAKKITLHERKMLMRRKFRKDVHRAGE